MSLFDFLKGQNKINGSQEAEKQAPKRKSLLQIAREAEERERLAQEANGGETVSEPAEPQGKALPRETDFYRIHFEKTDGLSIFDSKLGGVPYWNSEAAYPKDENGNPLLLLLQLNFDELTLQDDRLPSDGMLQFFISPDAGSEGRVVYHERIDNNVEPAALPSMPYREGFSPVLAAVRATLERTVWEETADGHKLFGTPAFCQNDPREDLAADEAEYFDTLLLQIDSDFNGGDPIILWGDSGVANFFINETALKGRRFDRVLFHWDCY